MDSRKAEYLVNALIFVSTLMVMPVYQSLLGAGEIKNPSDWVPIATVGGLTLLGTACALRMPWLAPIAAVAGFCAGVAAHALVVDSNLWPIAAGVWTVLSLPFVILGWVVGLGVYWIRKTILKAVGGQGQRPD